MPYWRDLLEAQWRTALTQVTELSLAFCETAERLGGDGGPAHGAAADGRRARQIHAEGGGSAGRTGAQLRQLERRTVSARRALADIEDALGRLSAGRYGRCEQCAADLPAGWLLRIPEARYCPRCSVQSRERVQDAVHVEQEQREAGGHRLLIVP